MKTIVIGCDEAAVELKNEIKALLEELEIPVEDVGVKTESDKELYPNIAAKVATKIIESGYNKRGIILCGTGIGMAMTANKFQGIRAAVAHDIFSIQRSVLSNNANVLTMGARIVAPQYAKMLVEEWVKLEFVDGSSTPKVNQIGKIEAENFRS